MAQFTCEICGAEFEQKSRYERHMLTSHPKQAVSAADIEKALKGVEFPKTRSELIDTLSGDEQEVRAIIKQLPDDEYRDAAEVARAFGELRTHEKAPDNQPSKTGGERAMQAPSAARFASLFSGMRFPADRQQLMDHARSGASEQEMQTLKQFGDHSYHSMADVTKELEKVK
ncbi:DUF2795 domain-containing protein [Vreelandella rituensis]|uniref:DUF2795 domain-containing protein n=1 Tax=Vreelandella rituensis TaxID=2282306 RepID=A0A368TUZ5_9GAMM|nr:DUF2795 domain-containing protein [Halomonas rituensis]RCV86963.1 DUF2795 domain-containing protein [Halomonas rituensis]